jgi:hypothetical protein
MTTPKASGFRLQTAPTNTALNFLLWQVGAVAAVPKEVTALAAAAAAAALEALLQRLSR